MQRQARTGPQLPDNGGAYYGALQVLQQRLLDLRQVQEEFRTVVQHDVLSADLSLEAATHPDNGPKNRYYNVLPYDYNRVRLASPPGQDPAAQGTRAPGQQGGGGGVAGRGRSGLGAPPGFGGAGGSNGGAGSGNSVVVGGSLGGYINASLVRHDDPDAGFQVAYIATQGPTPSTVADFWQMVLEQRTPVVVMLTNTTERGVTKCAPYFPQRQGERMALGAGGCLEVVALSCSRTPSGVNRRTIRITNTTTGQSSTVEHLHYSAWPDHGTPQDSGPIRAMCSLVQELSAAAEPRAGAGAGAALGAGDGAKAAPAGQGAGDPEPPPCAVVHCSAGIGRTGTFCAIDILMRRLQALQRQQQQQQQSGANGVLDLPAALADALDLPALVMEMRRQRGGMVQTAEQYAFVYQAVYEEAALALGAGVGAGAGQLQGGQR